MASYDDAPDVDYEPEEDNLPKQPGAGDSETSDDEEEAGPVPPPTQDPPRLDEDSSCSEGELHDGSRIKKPVQAQPPSRTMMKLEENTGIYIPPARRKLLQQQAANANASPSKISPSPASQRTTWEALKRTINGTINRLSVSTLKPLIHSLFSNANLLRGRGILTKSLLRATTASPQYANVYASLAAVINTKLPEIGELLVVRCILSFRRNYKSKDVNGVSSTLALMGHLFNQGVVGELLSLQILTVLLEGEVTQDSVEVACGYLCIVGQRLLETSPAGVHAVMERLRNLLHEGSIGKRGQYRIESILKVRKGGFREYPSVETELDLVEREDQITLEIGLDEEGLKREEGLDVFRVDEEYEVREGEWEEIRREILGEDDSSGSDDGSGEESESEDEVQDQEMPEAGGEEKKTVVVQDLTETDLVHLRRTIYLTIMSSATFEECTHKLAKMDIPEGREQELINMIIECCSQERTFLRYYGLVSGRFCLLHERWQDAFQEAFATQYNTIHRLETNKLRNVAKLFGHLLHTDAISWSVLSVIHLNEDETTSSSRIFIKILVQEMAEAMGMGTLKVRFDTDSPDPDGEIASAEETALVPARSRTDNNLASATTREWFKGIFPKDNARNTRYAINFFTSIGLGPLTDGMREFLKNAPKLILQQAQAMAAREAERKKGDSDESSVISTSSSSTSSFDSSSSSSFSSSSSYSSSSFSSYSSDSRKRSRGKGRKRRRSYSSSSSSSSSSGSRKRSSKKPPAKKKNKDSDKSKENTKSDAGKDFKADASSVGHSVSPSRDRHRSYSRSNSRSRSVSPSPVKDVEKKKSSKRSRSYSSSSSSSSSPSPPRKRKSKKHSKRERSGSGSR